MDVVIVGAGPVGLDLGEHPWAAGRPDPDRRGARHPDRLPARCRARRRGSAHVPVDRSRRTRCCRTPCRTRSCGSSTASADCSPRWRPRMRDSAGPSATVSFSRWSMPSCSAAWNASTTSSVRWGHRMDNCVEGRGRSHGRASARAARRSRARYVVGCDGGRSATRRLMGVSFDGTTSSTRWLVIDCAQRSAGSSQQRGRRRSRAAVRVDLHRARNPAFRVHDSRATKPTSRRRIRPSSRRMLGRLVPHPDRVDVIRHRRLHPPLAASPGRSAGTAVARRRRRAPHARVAGAGLQQRHPRRGQPRLEAGRGGQRPRRRRAARHLRRRAAQARTGDDRPVHVGRARHLADEPTGGGAARPRDPRRVSGADSLKRYVLEMRFKPMPRYEQGAVCHARAPFGLRRRSGRCSSSRASTPVSSGTSCSTTCSVPASPFCAGTTTRARCWATTRSSGGKHWRPSSLPCGRMTQLHWTGHDDPDVVIVGDRTGALKSWFDAHTDSVLFLRPDRCIAGACIAQRAPEMSAQSLFKVLYLTQGGGSGSHDGDTGSVLYVAQPATEPSGTVTGSP